MALELTILVGTMTGTAQLVAQEVELTLDDGDTRVQTRPMDGLDAGVFSAGGLFLICSSTYGQGDVPDNARHLYASPRARDPICPRCNTASLRATTCAETLLHGGRRFDAILAELGARRIGGSCCTTSAGTMPGSWLPPGRRIDQRCRRDAKLAA